MEADQALSEYIFVSFAIGQLDESWIGKIQNLGEILAAKSSFRLVDSSDLEFVSFSDDDSKRKSVGLLLSESDIWKCAYIPTLIECLETEQSSFAGKLEELPKRYKKLYQRMKANFTVRDRLAPAERIKNYFKSEMKRVLYLATQGGRTETLVLDSSLKTNEILSSLASTITSYRFALIRLVDEDRESSGNHARTDPEFKCAGAILALNQQDDRNILCTKIKQIRDEKKMQRALSKEIRVNITTNGKAIGTYDTFAENWKQSTAGRNFQEHEKNIGQILALDSGNSILEITWSESDEAKLTKPLSLLTLFRNGLSDDEIQVILDRINQVQQSVTFDIITSFPQIDAELEYAAAPAHLREPQQKEQQEHVARRILGRIEYLLGQMGKTVQQFSKLRFIVLVPNFTTLRDQTTERLRRGVDPSLPRETVIFYSDNCRPIFNAFREEAMKESNAQTLFLIIADEAHYAIVKGAAHDSFVNDSDFGGELLSRENLFILQVSATPYNLLTRSSRLPVSFVTKFRDDMVPQDVCDRKPSEDAEELHVVRWYSASASAGSQAAPKSEYLRLEDFFRSVYTNRRYLAAGLSKERHPIVAQLVRGDGWLASIQAKTSKERDYVLAVDYLFSLLYFALFRWNPVEGCLKSASCELEGFHLRIPLFCKHFENFTGGGPPEFKALEKIRKTVYSKIIENFGDPDFNANSDTSDGEDAAGVEPEALHYALKNLFTKKLQAERAAEADCSSLTASDADDSPCFTESDRIVRDLLDINVASGHGRMKMIRIKDKAHGDFFINVIHSAAQSVFEGSARHFQSSKETGQPFAVIGDWGAKFHASIKKQAPDFLGMVLASGANIEEIKRGKQRKELAVHDEVTFTHGRAGQLEGTVLELLDDDLVRVSVRGDEGSRLREAVVSRDNVELSSGRDILYSDLEGMPCILVLCEKGRMGDTFPQSLNRMDLRTRASEKLMTLIQELGRACRYPKQEREGFEFRGTAGPREEAEKLFKAGRAVAVYQTSGAPGPSRAFVGYASHWEPFGGLAVVEIAGHGALHAFDPSSAEVAFEDCALKWPIRSGQHVRVSLNLGRIVFDVQVEASQGLCQPGSASVLRGKIVLYTAGDSEQLRSEVFAGVGAGCMFLTDSTSLKALLEEREGCQVTPLVNNIPYILLKKEVVDCVARAAKTADEEGLEIWECLKLKSGLDSYMKIAGKKRRSTRDLHNYREEYLAQNVGHRNLSFDSLQGSPSSAELERHRHRNRLLLFAECQIGKTGAYCAVLRQLSERIAENQDRPDEWLPAVPISPELQRAVREQSRIKWALPFWRDVRDAKWEVRLKAGKYHPRIRGQRLATLLRAGLSGDEWFDDYARRIHAEEVVLASELRARLSSLRSLVLEKRLACPLRAGRPMRPASRCWMRACSSPASTGTAARQTPRAATRSTSRAGGGTRASIRSSSRDAPAASTAASTPSSARGWRTCRGGSRCRPWRGVRRNRAQRAALTLGAPPCPATRPRSSRLTTRWPASSAAARQLARRDIRSGFSGYLAARIGSSWTRMGSRRRWPSQFPRR